MAVEFDPKTGELIIQTPTSKEETKPNTDFVVNNEITETDKAPEVKSTLVGIKNKVDEAMKHNVKLNSDIVVPTIHSTTPTKPTRIEKIRNVLKNKGMDSQQVNQSIQMIEEILSEP